MIQGGPKMTPEGLNILFLDQKTCFYSEPVGAATMLPVILH